MSGSLGSVSSFFRQSTSSGPLIDMGYNIFEQGFDLAKIFEKNVCRCCHCPCKHGVGVVVDVVVDFMNTVSAWLLTARTPCRPTGVVVACTDIVSAGLLNARTLCPQGC